MIHFQKRNKTKFRYALTRNIFKFGVICIKCNERKFLCKSWKFMLQCELHINNIVVDCRTDLYVCRKCAINYHEAIREAYSKFDKEMFVKWNY